MIRGYFRLEPGKNNMHEKISALIEAGAASGNIFFETSGSKELNRMVCNLRRGDTVVIPHAADVCQNKEELSELIEKLDKKGAALRSLDEPWLDFNTDRTRRQNVRSILSQSIKTVGNLSLTEEADTKPAGRPKGPKREIMQKLDFAFRMYHSANHLSVSEICKTVKLNERTFYRHLERQGIQIIRRPKGRKPKKSQS